MEAINTIGRRKSAVARVYLFEGKGKVSVNSKDYKEYFLSKTDQYMVMQPLNLLSVSDKYDIRAILSGGGSRGQAEALRHGISRALVKINEEDKKTLKDEGFLKRDPREVERKKPGQPKARKRFQFSKR